MAEHFLSKIRVESGDFVDAGGRPVLERHDDLRRLLSDRAGPEVAALFAEPLISRGNDEAPPTVSWYSDAEGEARPLAQLSGAERDRAEAYLADHLRPLRSLAEDPTSADLALGALSVYGRDDVVVQGGRPLIVNWGLLPGGMGANAAARPAHYADTLGRFLPLTASSGNSGVAGAAGFAATSGAAAVRPPQTDSSIANAGMTGATGGGGPAVTPDPTPRRAGISPIAWVPLLILLIVAGLTLAWLLQPGSRLFHAATPPVITDEATLKAARALNQSLRERTVVLEQALEGAVCRADGILLLPDGRTPEGLLPPALGVEPDKKAQAAPDALLPNSPGRVLVPEPDASGEPGDITLLALIEARTVLILAASGGGVTAGSGFVVGPGLILTNHHVIEGAMAQPGQILVAGAALDHPRAATVLKTQGPMAETGGDFALLKVDGAPLPAFSVHLGAGSLKLTNVIAAGYPGDVLELDVSFAALKSGDMSATPDLTVTDGTINTEQQIGPDTHVLMHSAPLSSGNSGGPLVDMCGRVVGVNTFVRQGKMQNRGFALTAGDMLAFLNGTDAAPTVMSGPCAPVVVRRQVTAAPSTLEPAKGD
ncbi:MAG: hypothetical protein ACI8R4_001735 [Paracoccaceae bacterium]|jgi:hypothetical protein